MSDVGALGVEGWSVESMAELGARHADLEGRGELEALIDTLVDDPLYEFHPLGRGMRGGTQVRRFYTWFVDNFLPLRAETELVGQWVNERAIVQEYVLNLSTDAGSERHHVTGILYVDADSARQGLLKGERVYSSERFIQLMTGPVYEELHPL